MIKISWDYFTCKNSKSDDKPNEDVGYYKPEHCVGVLLDGVSRDKENGKYPSPSPATIATEIFATEILNQASQFEQISLNELQSIIVKANEKVKEYNEILQHRFPAGTVGVVFSISKNIMNYAYIGDSYAFVIRDNKRRIFTECQTTEVTKHKREFTSDEIRFEICNHITHPCGYGVWDGNLAAMDFVKYGSIQLKQDDVIYFYSDGLAEEMEKLNIEELIQRKLEDLFTSCPKPGVDDRTCLKISVTELS